MEKQNKRMPTNKDEENFMSERTPLNAKSGIHKEKTAFEKWAEYEADYSLWECFLLTLMLLIIGAAVLVKVEGWLILDSLYFTLVLLTTVGYGDMAPISPEGKLFASLFALSGGVIIGLALGVVGSELVDSEIENLMEGGSKQKSGVEKLGQKCWSTLRIIVPISAPLIICYLENWQWYDGIYYTVISGTTVGLGDLVPTTKFGEIAAIAFIPFAVAAMAHILDECKSFVMNRRREKHYKKLGSFELTQDDFDALDANGDEEVTESEYIRYMLKIIEPDVYKDLYKSFQQLDVTNDGVFTKEDLKQISQRELSKLQLRKLNRQASKE